MFAGMMLAALLAVSAENLFFTGGMGFSRVLRAARSPRGTGMASAFVIIFSLFSAIEGFWLTPFFPSKGWAALAVRPAALAGLLAVTYIVLAGVLKKSVPAFYEKNNRVLPLSAVNTAVLAIPYVQKAAGFSLLQSIGFALGSGLSFLIASALLSCAIPVCNNPDMPKAFKGLPASLLYVGILSMAFAGFTGGFTF